MEKICSDDNLNNDVVGIYKSNKKGLELIKSFRKQNSDFFKLFIFDLFEGSVVDAIMYEVNILLLFLVKILNKKKGKLDKNDIKELSKFDVKSIQDNCLFILQQKISNWFTETEININKRKFNKLILGLIRKIVLKIIGFIDDLKSESLLSDVFGLKKNQDICDIIPFFVFAGIPYKINKKLKEGIKKLRNYNAIVTSDNIKLLKSLLCLKLIEGIITDFLNPFKKILKLMLNNALLNKIDLEICLQNSNGDINKINECKKKYKEKTPEEMKKMIDDIIKPGPKRGGGGDLIGGALIGEGSYGCVFKPALGCDGIEFSDFTRKKYVSKLMIDYKWKIDKEYMISKIIQTIPNYQNRFAPLLDICFVDIKKLNLSNE